MSWIYNNQVIIHTHTRAHTRVTHSFPDHPVPTLYEASQELRERVKFSHPHPATKVQFFPSASTAQPDLVATAGDYLRLWEVKDKANTVNFAGSFGCACERVRGEKGGRGNGKFVKVRIVFLNPNPTLPLSPLNSPSPPTLPRAV